MPPCAQAMLVQPPRGSLCGGTHRRRRPPNRARLRTHAASQQQQQQHLMVVREAAAPVALVASGDAVRPQPMPPGGAFGQPCQTTAAADTDADAVPEAQQPRGDPSKRRRLPSIFSQDRHCAAPGHFTICLTGQLTRTEGVPSVCHVLNDRCAIGSLWSALWTAHTPVAVCYTVQVL